MINRIKLIPLAIGLACGVVAILFIKDEKKVVYKYPNPETCSKIVYKDKNGVCYKYIANKLDCDKNEGKLKNFPLST